jgi:hypothetical protein
MMRPKSNEVLAGLRLHAAGEERAVRAKDLAGKLGLPGKVVSNALNWLAVESKRPQVQRVRPSARGWFVYWWTGD